MIGLPAGTRIWIAAGVTDPEKGFSCSVVCTIPLKPVNPRRRVFSRRDWSEEDSSGRKQRVEQLL